MGTIEKTFLIRDTKSDTGTVPSLETPTYSPDIISYQNFILSYTEAKATYPDYICKSFLQETINLIYVRGKNNTGIAQNGEVKAFYSPLSLLYLPDQWKPLYTETKKEVVELCQPAHEKSEPGAIVLCNNPYVLQKVENPDEHHCLMALSRQKGEKWLELPEQFDGDKELWQFLRQHSNIAYNNIVIDKGFTHQHSLFVRVGNHNNYEDYYAVRFTLEKNGRYKAGTFGSCNIGRIQLLCTDIETPFDLNIYPDKNAESVTSPAFKLPSKSERSIILTYYAADKEKKVYGTIKHDYFTCDSRNMLPVNKAGSRCLATGKIDGAEVAIYEAAKLGDFAVLFSDREEDSIKSLNLIHSS